MHPARLVAMLTLALASTAHAAGYLPCSYAGHKTGFEEHAGCARPAGDGFVIRKRHLARMAFDDHGLVNVFIVNQFYYVKPDGECCRCSPTTTARITSSKG